VFFKNLLRYRNSAREAEYPDIGHYADNHYFYYSENTQKFTQKRYKDLFGVKNLFRQMN